MKINEIINEDISAAEQSAPETPEKKILPAHDAVHPNEVIRARDIGGYDRVYHMNRLMMAMAKADGRSKKAVDSAAETWFEKYNTLHPYTKEENNMVHAAMKSVPTDGQVVSYDNKSHEADDTHKVSPVVARKKNKYGV